MLTTKQTSFLKTFTILFTIILALGLFFFTGCNEEFDSATKLNINQPNTTEANLKHTTITVKEPTDEIYVSWTIATDANTNATHYSLVVLDKDKNALTTTNGLTSVTVYDQDKKSLGTATTETPGNYNLATVLGDNKIAAGTYYAILKFAKEGTYNLSIQLAA